ncbi:membrane protein [Streptomyces daqingensis]|uniref:Membrane protein n=1 Tax=Streptomyces daqingensis TaxID=1472640 RepID=A0ABQ2M3K3_9ACTN|nr:DoxX family protein [Streptomyces daqingensis]GGO46461.1 membrane protein [Streptomyces daqingensis]
MSVDTRTPRTPGPSGGRPGDTQRKNPSGFYDDTPALSTVKVPSDPAEVVVTHASFRVQLTPPSGTATRPSAPEAGAAPAEAADLPPRRRGPVDWGRTEDPDALFDTGSGASGLRQGAHGMGTGTAEPAAATTQVLPRIADDTAPPRHDRYADGYERYDGPRGYSGAPDRTRGTGADSTGGSPTVVGQRSARPSESTQPHRLLEGVRPAQGAFDTPERGSYDGDSGSYAYDDSYDGDLDGKGRFDDRADFRDGPEADAEDERDGLGAVTRIGARRQAYYPGRRMNLGVVLLPMRIFLGFISVYAGMGKLCDPVYFDGGERGSMVTWLNSLEPWAIASPLHDFAVAHPVGAGLTVAFVQIIVGVLTVCGLWQRLAASVGVLLSAALLMTVSWSNGPAYEAPDIIYLAAWSPLVIAGAPVYSIDGRLAGDAWRKLGPRADLWELRRRVLRRGTVIASVVTGVALLTGSLLGGAVRSAQTARVQEPGEPPTNQLPGSPLPKTPGARDSGLPTQGQGSKAPGSRHSGGPSASASPGDRRGGGPSSPSQRETVQAPQQTVPGVRPPQQSNPGVQATSGGSTGGTGGGSTGGGGSNSGGGGGGSSSSGGGGGSSSGGSGSGGGGGLGGLLG